MRIKNNLDQEKIDLLAQHYKSILTLLGEDVQREGLLDTPQRIAKAMQFLTSGYTENPEKVIRKAIFQEKSNQMIVVQDIDIYSVCEHHLLPFFGKAQVAYVPNGAIVGLSKIPRICDIFAQRLQVQERLTDQIKNCLQENLNPLGVAVSIKAQHLCMQMRGIQKQNTYTRTFAYSGIFEQEEQKRIEFLQLILDKN